MENQKQISIVFIVAGISSRFGGRIKQFARVGPNGETLIELSVRQALSAGFNKIIFVVGNKTEQGFKEIFREEFDGIPVKYAYQTFDENTRDRPWGTGDALASINGVIDCPFVVCNGDDLYGENTFKILAKHLQESEDGATIGYKLGEVLSEKGPVNRAIFKLDGDNVICIAEEFAITRENIPEKGLTENILCSQNIFALNPKDVEELAKKADKFQQEHFGDRKIEFLLSNELSKLIEEGKLRMKIYSTPDEWIGVTNPEDEEIVRNYLKSLKS